MSIAEMKWTRQPADYRIEPGRIEITTEPHTDLWQRTYSGHTIISVTITRRCSSTKRKSSTSRLS